MAHAQVNSAAQVAQQTSDRRPITSSPWCLPSLFASTAQDVPPSQNLWRSCRHADVAGWSAATARTGRAAVTRQKTRLRKSPHKLAPKRHPPTTKSNSCTAAPLAGCRQRHRIYIYNQTGCMVCGKDPQHSDQKIAGTQKSFHHQPAQTRNPKWFLHPTANWRCSKLPLSCNSRGCYPRLTCHPPILQNHLFVATLLHTSSS